MLTSSKLQPRLLENKSKASLNITLEAYKLYAKVQPISVFLDIVKFADFWLKYADVGKTHGMCHVIYMFFESPLGKV